MCTSNIKDRKLQTTRHRNRWKHLYYKLNSTLTSQFSVLWNTKIHGCLFKELYPRLVNICTTYCPEIYFNIILPSVSFSLPFYFVPNSRRINVTRHQNYSLPRRISLCWLRLVLHGHISPVHKYESKSAVIDGVHLYAFCNAPFDGNEWSAKFPYYSIQFNPRFPSFHASTTFQ